MSMKQLLLVAFLIPIALAACDSEIEESGVDDPYGRSHGEPPHLLVRDDSGVVEVPGFDYCWDGACADSFGAHPPTPIGISETVVRIEWIENGVLTATTFDETAACVDGLGLDPGESPGVWELRASGRSSPYLVSFHGSAGENTAVFAIEVTSTVTAPNALPIASVWWPDTQDVFSLGVALEHAGTDPDVWLEITDSRGEAVTVPLQSPGFDIPGRCGPVVVREAQIEGIDQLGEPPFAAVLVVDSPLGLYELSWRWPDDLREDGELVRTMRSASQ
jgi:hypothetical protein